MFIAKHVAQISERSVTEDMNASVQGKKKNTVLHRMKKYRILYLLAIIPFAYLIVFRYWPIFLQFVLATKNYTIKGGIWGSPFIGLDNFAQLFQSQEFQKILFNTIEKSLISGWSLKKIHLTGLGRRWENCCLISGNTLLMPRK